MGDIKVSLHSNDCAIEKESHYVSTVHEWLDMRIICWPRCDMFWPSTWVRRKWSDASLSSMKVRMQVDIRESNTFRNVIKTTYLNEGVRRNNSFLDSRFLQGHGVTPGNCPPHKLHRVLKLWAGEAWNGHKAWWGGDFHLDNACRDVCWTYEQLRALSHRACEMPPLDPTREQDCSLLQGTIRLCKEVGEGRRDTKWALQGLDVYTCPRGAMLRGPVYRILLYEKTPGKTPGQSLDQGIGTSVNYVRRGCGRVLRLACVLPAR